MWQDHLITLSQMDKETQLFFVSFFLVVFSECRSEYLDCNFRILSLDVVDDMTLLLLPNSWPKPVLTVEYTVFWSYVWLLFVYCILKTVWISKKSQRPVPFLHVTCKYYIIALKRHRLQSHDRCLSAQGCGLFYPFLRFVANSKIYNTGCELFFKCKGSEYLYKNIIGCFEQLADYW